MRGEMQERHTVLKIEAKVSPHKGWAYRIVTLKSGKTASCWRKSIELREGGTYDLTFRRDGRFLVIESAKPVGVGAPQPGLDPKIVTLLESINDHLAAIRRYYEMAPNEPLEPPSDPTPEPIQGG
jgi:hypothetical protein